MHIYMHPLEIVFQSTRPRGARPELCGCSLTPTLFQSTRPRGARRAAPASVAPHCCFNPRAREGRDVKYKHLAGGGMMFQSTRPRGARPCMTSPLPDGLEFQSTRPRGARRPAFPCHAVHDGFNPRAREGRDVRRLYASLRRAVSIHAPARGATAWIWALADSAAASFNPRAREGRDGSIASRWTHACRFNPRAREGRDQNNGLRDGRVFEVSIHAPARGAT